MHASTIIGSVQLKDGIREHMVITVGSVQRKDDPREHIDDQCSGNYSKRALYNVWTACKDLIDDHTHIINSLKKSVQDKERSIRKMYCKLRLHETELENMGRVEMVANRWNMNHTLIREELLMAANYHKILECTLK